MSIFVMVILKTTEEIGALIQKTRKHQKLTQAQLAAVSGVGIRFIVDIEKGKPTCQIGKILRVLHMLGIHFQTDKEMYA